MKNFFKKILISSVIITGIVILLNINVTFQQGVNYQVKTVKIPLYLKILNFFDRYYNYKELVKRILKDEKNQKKKVMKIFNWTHENIRKVPKDFPVVDDHVWHIIIRGYGTSDQVSDVFSTLCNYANLEAFFTWIYAKDSAKRIPLSFVKIENKWIVFDPYRGVYFQDNTGNLADVNTIKLNSGWRIEGGKPELDYKDYFVNISDIKQKELQRANIQSPIKRFIYEVKKWLN